MRYLYLGDRLTDAKWKGRQCDPVLRPDGKCITSKLGTMLVAWEDGSLGVVLRRQLRKNGLSRKRAVMFKYFVANDGIGGVKIRLSGTDVQKVPEVIAVMVKADHHEATAEEYREACKKARLQMNWKIR